MTSTQAVKAAQLRQAAEDAFAEELDALRQADDRPRPPNWQMSPQGVVTYLMGGTLASGQTITPKYIGDRRLMEVAVATLATDRALLLLGVPGTAKSWVSEHLAAAICGTSRLIVQGTAFNWPWPDHFRVVTLPRVDDLEQAIGRIGNFLKTYRQ